jgi:pimeloyl-ACP methyl ester carboxylesterase
VRFRRSLPHRGPRRRQVPARRRTRRRWHRRGVAYAGATQVVVVDPVPFKRQMAKVFGATHAFETHEEALEFVRHATWGHRADHAIGHGSRWQELRHTHWQQWVTEGQRVLASLHPERRRVVAMGLGVGATLALLTAALNPQEVSGVVAVNPLITRLLEAPTGVASVLRRSYLAGSAPVGGSGAVDARYRRVPARAARTVAALGTHTRAALAQISCPVLLIVSGTDEVVDVADAELVERGLPAPARMVRFSDSTHVIPLAEAASMMSRSLQTS